MLSTVSLPRVASSLAVWCALLAGLIAVTVLVSSCKRAPRLKCALVEAGTLTPIKCPNDSR